MNVFDCDQYSDEWWAIRRGVPTASMFGKLITPKTGKPSAQADDYVFELIGDMYDPHYGSNDGYQSQAMAEGTAREPEAREWYSQAKGVEVKQVGFVMDEALRFGCSPDGLIEPDGGLEIKCPTPKVHASYLAAGELPAAHKPQVHGSLVVTGRGWWDFVSYCPPMPSLVVRVEPDGYTEQMRDAMAAFWDSFASMREAFNKMEIK